MLRLERLWNLRESNSSPRAVAGSPLAPRDCVVRVVGVEHDGLVLVARTWPDCTEVGYTESSPQERYQVAARPCAPRA